MLDWLLRGERSHQAPPDPDPPLRAEARLPIHILTEHAELCIEDGMLAISGERDDRRVRLDEVSLVAIHGAATVTTPCLGVLADAGIPVLLLSASGYYRGQLVDLSQSHAATRRAQYAAAANPAMCLQLARGLIEAKIAGAARLLRRRSGASDPVHRRLREAAKAAARARGLDALRGVEGAAAAAWYGALPTLLLRHDELFVFDSRSRRPPRDAVNALLSYLYAVLTGQAAAAALAHGLDPNVGFLHAERPGRPALGLDLVEPLRTFVADAAAIAAINNGEFGAEDFDTQDDGSVRLTRAGRRAALAILERRLSTEVSYEGTEMTWRGSVSHHALQLARALREGHARVPFPQPK
jgi:CRISPR-associated endonuclease Cas1